MSQNSWDQVNIELAKSLMIGSSNVIRVHGGGNFSRVAIDGLQSVSGESRLAGAASTKTYTTSTTSIASYNGFGGRIGLDLGHNWQNGLSIYANGAASI